MANFDESPNPFSPPSQSSGYASYTQIEGPDVPIRNVVPVFGDILNYAVKIWKENLLLVVLGSLIVIGIAIGLAIVNFLIDVSLKGGFQNPPNPTSAVFSMIGSLVANVVQLFLTIGHVRFNLNLLRGKPAELGMIFQGGDRFLPTLGFSILLGLAVTAGLVLCIVPGFILLFLFWPGYYLVIDRKTPVFESFGIAREITKGNFLNTLLLGLTSFAIIFVGLLALCVGIFVAQPLVLLLGGASYLMMSGQISPTNMQSDNTSEN